MNLRTQSKFNFRNNNKFIGFLYVVCGHNCLVDVNRYTNVCIVIQVQEKDGLIYNSRRWVNTSGLDTQ